MPLHAADGEEDDSRKSRSKEVRNRSFVVDYQSSPLIYGRLFNRDIQNRRLTDEENGDRIIPLAVLAHLPLFVCLYLFNVSSGNHTNRQTDRWDKHATTHTHTVLFSTHSTPFSSIFIDTGVAAVSVNRILSFQLLCILLIVSQRVAINSTDTERECRQMEANGKAPDCEGLDWVSGLSDSRASID